MPPSLIATRIFDPLVRSTDRDPDIEQASLRVIVCGIAFAYVCYLILSSGGIGPGLLMGLIASTSDAIVGIAMIAMLRHGSARGPAMRYLGIVADNVALTVGIAGAGEAGVAMIGVYLWVTIGNGFRFGPRYLLASYWFSIAGLAALCTFAPFWLQHRAVGAGLLLALAIVPLYVLVLLIRLTAQKDAAEQLSNAKSRFVANVSHELRTPLTGITAVYDLLRGRKLDSDGSELVGMLGNALKNLKTSVDAVLQMSKLEAGAERTVCVPFNLPYFLQLLSAIVKPQSTVKNINWHLDIDASAMKTVLGDQGHLSHVLGNLLNNAFKFTSSGGVTLKARLVSNGRARFEVIDTGIGIPPDKQEHLFERFVQVDNSATRRYTGTGLGTSIARDLTELMGGAIGVTSAPGRGSTFWVELPLAEHRDPTWKLPDTELRKEVLLITDDVNNTSLVHVIDHLSSFGLQHVIVNTNAASVIHLDVQKYLAAMFVMPARRVVECIKRSLRHDAVITCPWVVISSDSSSVDTSALLSAGACGVMCGELTRSALGSTLSGLIHRIDVPVGEDETVHTQAPTDGVFRVLVADDNRSIQLLLRKILEGAGHQVRTAERGDEAFDIMATGSVDLAILDLNMPEMSGPDIVTLFRAGSVGASELPIVILSADATPAARDDSLAAGANEYLTKPVSSAVLLATIQRLMASADGTRQHEAAAQPTYEAVPQMQAASNLVDFERIHAVRDIARSDSKFLETYLTAAFSELGTAISQLRDAVGRRDVRAARDALHIIEGTGASVGAVGLVTNCRAMRQRLAQEDGGDFQAAIAELSTSYALSKSTILATLDRTPPARESELPQRHS